MTTMQELKGEKTEQTLNTLAKLFGLAIEEVSKSAVALFQLTSSKRKDRGAILLFGCLFCTEMRFDSRSS
ncbi:hypothetical protein NLM27_41940 [Bradyrhizobium sp. CCGB12]|uniref:hypothetical protein n=1 Tax=Bradyrhizobium sp. CCGB12 TaxID=2949632 RepID=UPI0020B25E7E|nr:hypothetical protein [Bradyrhizobium sp. CCGB12]MCP3395297.1 hypothetical protein [Bradyrhizobium sp. CCGB12]